MPDKQFDFLTLAEMSQEEASKLVGCVREEIKYKPIEPFEIEQYLRKFLFALRLALETPNKWETLTPAQNDARNRQNARLVITLVGDKKKPGPILEDYRKHVLSAMTGREIESQHDLNWFDKGKILDALKNEEQNGAVVLKAIQKDVIERSACRSSDIYSFLFGDTKTEPNI